MSEALCYPVILPTEMAKSRTKRPLVRAFGGALKALHSRFEQQRGRDFSHEAVARLVNAHGPHLSMSGPTLWRWEEGQVESPDPLILGALAHIYGADSSALLRVLDANRRDPSLREGDGDTILQGGGDARTTASAELSSHSGPAPGSLSGDDTIGLAVVMLDIADQLQRTAEYLIGRQAAVAGGAPAVRAVRAGKSRRRSHR